MSPIQTPTRSFSSRNAAAHDRALQKTVVLMLKESGYRPVARLECRVEDGVVELVGVVPSYYMKQVAQAVIQRLDQVQGIRNEIHVL